MLGWCEPTSTEARLSPRDRDILIFGPSLWVSEKYSSDLFSGNSKGPGGIRGLGYLVINPFQSHCTDGLQYRFVPR